MKKLILLSAVFISGSVLSAVKLDTEHSKRDIAAYEARIEEVRTERIYEKGLNTNTKLESSIQLALATIAFYTNDLLTKSAIQALPTLIPEILLGRPKGSSGGLWNGFRSWVWASEGRHERELKKVVALALWGLVGGVGVRAAMNLVQEITAQCGYDSYIKSLQTEIAETEKVVGIVDPTFKKKGEL